MYSLPPSLNIQSITVHYHVFGRVVFHEIKKSVSQWPSAQLATVSVAALDDTLHYIEHCSLQVTRFLVSPATAKCHQWIII